MSAPAAGGREGTNEIEIRMGTGRKVLLVPGYANKIAITEEGIEHNRRESERWHNADDARRQILCPVFWFSPDADILVMQRAVAIPENEFDSDRAYRLVEDFYPGIDCEFKASGWGVIDGRWVVVDYGNED